MDKPGMLTRLGKNEAKVEAELRYYKAENFGVEATLASKT